MFGSQLVPHANFPSYDVNVGYPWFILIHGPPILVNPIVVSVEVVEPNVEVHFVIIGQNNLIFPTLQPILIQARPPPMDNILILQRQIYLLICPVDDFLLRTNFLPEHRLLFPSVIDRQIVVCRDTVCHHVVLYVLLLAPAVVHHLVPSEMDVLVVEGCVDVGEDLLDDVPGHR
jgi:hypothetical protein